MLYSGRMTRAGLRRPIRLVPLGQLLEIETMIHLDTLPFSIG